MRSARRTGSPCEQVREALSAAHDGEAVPAGRPVDAHLAGCEGCASFAASLDRLDDRVLAARALPAADLTAGVLAAVTAEARAERDRRVLELRWIVALAGAVQLLIALPLVLGVAGPAAHVGRDLGALELALGIGLLFAAWQPERAAGVLPVAAVVATAAVVTGVLDLAAGRATLLQELPHLTEIVGVLALWALTRRLPRPRLTAPIGSTA
ncbi:zf-HC2 domain-containing protein [Egicoccus sp. AB-alg2]|uniref:zf-HC2 domain-containing protein n=1 Tax=Egicoccus sp. AB-alg2 TaxID=3242693 RepID=UPI00359D4FF1